MYFVVLLADGTVVEPRSSEAAVVRGGAFVEKIPAPTGDRQLRTASERVGVRNPRQRIRLCEPALCVLERC
jgi:hypothetical protein